MKYVLLAALCVVFAFTGVAKFSKDYDPIPFGRIGSFERQGDTLHYFVMPNLLFVMDGANPVWMCRKEQIQGFTFDHAAKEWQFVNSGLPSEGKRCFQQNPANWQQSLNTIKAWYEQ